jgi:hypothetical protein
MTDFVPAEKAMPVREPSTANLMVDSLDRNNINSTTCANFSISKSNSLMNGFFTRVGVTEVVFDWLEPNINSTYATNVATLDISGGSTYNVSVPVGFYTVAQLLDAVVQRFNDISGTTTTAFVINNAVSPPTLSATNAAIAWNILIAAGYINGFQSALYTPAGGVRYLDGVADLRLYKYIDFVSPELTYNQDLKDGATNNSARDVLTRWYMEWDNPAPLDKYGYPIAMGTTSFQVRRLFSPAKQIRWEPNQPLGQVSFQLYVNSGLISLQPLQITNNLTNWRMTLQMSEV